MKNCVRLIAVVALLSLVGAAPAFAQCSISGSITAAPSGDPALPDWEYTLTVTWDTDVQFALSHFDLIIDAVGGTCDCQDLQEALTLVNPAGSSDGVGGCTVNYDAFLECDGDPSIPGVTGFTCHLKSIYQCFYFLSGKIENLQSNKIRFGQARLGEWDADLVWYFG